MAKSNHFPGLLLLTLVCIYFCIACDIVEQSQDQRANIKDFSRVTMGSRGLNVSSREDWIKRVKRIYDSQVGVRESGTNSGPQVEKYLEYVRLSKGQPWCAAFVCWVYGRAGVGNPRTGWSPGLFRGDNVIWEKAESGFARRSVSEGGKAEMHNYPKRLVTLTRSTYPTSLATVNRQQVTPRAGDIFGIYFPEKKRIAHVGFIDQWDGNWLITVEGNTNSSGDREGDGVYRKRRPIRSIYRVARYIN